MDLYYNHIVDRLLKTTCINRSELFNSTINENKRKFLIEINVLLQEERIIKDYASGPDRFRYSPKVLKIHEYEKKYGIKTATFNPCYFPTAVLEKELGFIKKGDGPEDVMEFALQIEGLQLKEADKHFFESHNDIKLNFEQFDYFLWAEYLDPYKELNDSPQKKPTILYIDNDSSFSMNFIKELKKVHLPDSNWLVCRDTGQAMFSLETKLEIYDSIDLIITEHNNVLNGIEFIEAIEELQIELEEKHIYFNIPIIAFTNSEIEPGLSAINTGREHPVMHFSKFENSYLISNVIKSLCSKGL